MKINIVVPSVKQTHNLYYIHVSLSRSRETGTMRKLYKTFISLLFSTFKPVFRRKVSNCQLRWFQNNKKRRVAGTLPQQMIKIRKENSNFNTYPQTILNGTGLDIIGNNSISFNITGCHYRTEWQIWHRPKFVNVFACITDKLVTPN